MSLAVEGEQGRVHDLENAGQQGRGFKRTYALFLQQVGESIDFSGQFAQRIGRAGAARAKGVVSLAQRRHDVGKRLQRTDHAFNQRGGDQRKIKQQTAGSSMPAQRRCALVEKNCGKDNAGSASSRQYSHARRTAERLRLRT